MSAGTLVLLLASINVAGLSVACVLTGRQELAIRRASGARGWRIARAVLSETLIIGAVSGAIGLAIAAGLMPALRALLPGRLPTSTRNGFPLARCQFRTRCRIGRKRAGRACGRSAGGGQGSQRGSPRRRPHRLCLARDRTPPRWTRSCRNDARLCFAAGLLMPSSLALEERPNGFHPEGTLTFELAFPSQGYDAEGALHSLPRWSAAFMKSLGDSRPGSRQALRRPATTRTPVST